MPIRKRNFATQKKTELLPGFPYPLVQRGNNRQSCFRSRKDNEAYLELWREKSHWYGVQVHAYCLMTNHVPFILSSEAVDAISNTMNVVGDHYAYHFNERYGRTVTLREGQHRSSPIDADNSLRTCFR